MRLGSRRVLAPLAILLVGVPVLWWAARPKDERADLIATVTQRDFQVTVTTAGELRAPKFTRIEGPTRLMEAGVYEFKIASLVPEGTIVRQGDLVAVLDAEAIGPKQQETQLAVDKARVDLRQAELDSTLTLNQAREEIRDLEVALEEKRIAKEQATFEAPSVRRQADLDYEKAQRKLEQTRATYGTKREQAVAKVGQAVAELARVRGKLDLLTDVAAGFTVRAPAAGMVTYYQEGGGLFGRPRGVGSSVHAQDPIIAILPDLSEMRSITYVNELDVGKVAIGQRVRVSLDAEPSRKLTGKVLSVANAGQQRPGSDAKVFEVVILIEQSDSLLRPGMTTANVIETGSVANAVSIPLEALMTAGDTVFVYLRDGRRVVRQQVETGLVSENEVVIRRGLANGDRVLLTEPANSARLERRPLPSRALPPRAPR